MNPSTKTSGQRMGNRYRNPTDLSCGQLLVFNTSGNVRFGLKPAEEKRLSCLEGASREELLILLGFVLHLFHGHRSHSPSQFALQGGKGDRVSGRHGHHAADHWSACPLRRPVFLLIDHQKPKRHACRQNDPFLSKPVITVSNVPVQQLPCETAACFSVWTEQPAEQLGHWFSRSVCFMR